MTVGAASVDVQLLDGDVYWLCGISIAMKPIQVTFDEALLERLDRASGGAGAGPLGRAP